MNQTSSQPCSFPVPMRWLRAGNDPSRSDHRHQLAECSLVRSELMLGCLFYARKPRLPAPPRLVSCQHHVHHQGRPDIKSRWRRLSSRCQTSHEFVPWRFLDAGQLSALNVPPLPASKTCTISDLCTRHQPSTSAANRCRSMTAGLGGSVSTPVRPVSRRYAACDHVLRQRNAHCDFEHATEHVGVV